MPHLRPILLIATLFAIAVFWMATDTAVASRAFADPITYTVNLNDDSNDNDCNGVSGDCSLREAIQAANTDSNASTIEFALTGAYPSISVNATLLILQPVSINGNTGGATKVELNGAGTAFGVDGLNIMGGSTTIRNLVINRFGGDAIEINTGGGNLIEGCYIGLGTNGTTALTTLDGISIVNSSNNTIGGTTAATRNLITASRDGVYIEDNTGAQTSVTTGNVIQGNYIGTDVGGSLALGGSGTGIALEGADGNTIGGTVSGAGNVIVDWSNYGIDLSDANGNFIQGNIIGLAANGSTALQNFGGGIELLDSMSNTIGGTTHTANTCDGACNVISGNGAEGIFVSGLSSSDNNVIQGNFIGTDKSGTADRGNEWDGISISGGNNNTIGGTASGAGNLISGNNDNGIQIRGNFSASNLVQGNYIGTNAAGTNAIGNDIAGVYLNGGDNNTLGGTTSGARNVISGNLGDGIDVQNGATGNQVQGNYIGLNANGTSVLGNTFDGIYVDSASNTIGGTASGAGNVISGNGSVGLRLAGTTATGNQIQGNYIGTSANGSADLGNAFSGVYIHQGTNNTIGGTASGAGNVISGNRNGVFVDGGATGNQVQGNFIGTNAAGTSALGNDIDGVYLEAPANTVGGTTSGARNVISGNNTFGIEIYGSTATGNNVQGNYIGTDKNGTADLGNRFEGVIIGDSSNNTIGGTTSAHRNVISGNGGAGVDIYGSTSTGNAVQGNYIGTKSDGTSALGNDFVGVWIELGASNNTIGGTASGAGNVIAFNANDGVFVEAGTGNAIDPNSIFSNGGLGIDLGTNGVTANDTGDGDTGPNNLQNYPVLTSATTSGGNTTIAGTLNSTANTSFLLEFFSIAVCDGTNGEGQTYLGSTNVTTNGSGDASINVTFAVSTTTGHFVAATATRNTTPLDTSEFSGCQQISATPTALELEYFTGQYVAPNVRLTWKSASELQLVGFNVWRREKQNAEIQLNSELIPAQNPGAFVPSEYLFEDENVAVRKKYTYRLEPILANGASGLVEPFNIKIPRDSDACAAKPKRVKLSTPQNGETVKKRRVTLDWNDVKCTTNYAIVIRKGDANGKIVEQADAVTTSEYVTKQLKRGVAYYWSAQACNPAGCGKPRGGTFIIRP